MTKTTIPSPSSPTSESQKISEAFLHYIWKTKNFESKQLISTAGKRIKLLHIGVHNHNAGPDFLDGKIEYEGVVWAGHIELHIRSSDWYRHHHQVDPAYDQVVLHVVWEDDRPVTDMHLNPIITLELKGRVDLNLITKTNHLIHSHHRLACAPSIGNISTFWLNAWKERQLIERLEYRTNKILDRLQVVRGDWEQMALELFFRSMGFHANSDSLEALAQDISWKQIRKVVFDEKSIQALLFGRAALLDAASSDVFFLELKGEYEYLKTKFKLPSKVFIKWNFKGARPANFPTVRIAQLASMLKGKTSLIRSIIDADSIEKLLKLFSVALSAFWENHYTFNKSVEKTRLRLSIQSKQILIINYCVPLLYAYGFAHSRDDLKERAIHLLYSLPSENNTIIKEFKKAQVTSRCAAETQALLHTYRNYCAAKRCLECQAGSKIIGLNRT